MKNLGEKKKTEIMNNKIVRTRKWHFFKRREIQKSNLQCCFFFNLFNEVGCHEKR